MRKIASTLLLLFTISFYTLAQGSWTQQNDFPGQARSGAVSFTIGDSAYVGTGNIDNNQVQDFWRYDPTTDTWTRIADFPGGIREDAVAFSIDGKGYVGTGSSGPYNALVYYKDFWQYDPVSNTWEQVADFGGVARSHAITFVIDEKAYVGVGTAEDYKLDLWEYNPTTNAWTQKADLTGDPRTGGVAFSIDGIGYLGAGLFYENGSPHITNNLFAYDPTTDTWSEKVFAHLYLSRQYGQSFVIDGKAYLVTGGGSGDFVMYNPQNNSLSLENSSNRKPIEDNDRTSAIAFAVNDQAYVGTGYYYEVFSGGTFKNDLWSFEPPPPPSAPAAPNNLVATMNGYSTIRISWSDRSDNETHFVVEVSETGAEGSFSEIETLVQNSTWTNNHYLKEYQTYYYRVKAVNDIGASAYSATVTITTPLRTPDNFIASPVSSHETLLQWENISTFTAEIVVERSEDSVSFTKIATLSAEVTSFTDSKLSIGKKYYYRLKNTTSNDQTTLSSIVSTSPNANLGGWTKRSNHPLWSEKVGFSINNKGYAGFDSDQHLWEYNPETELWRKRAQAPSPRINDIHHFVVGQKAYVGGGYAYDGEGITREWWSYDPSSDTWLAIAQAPLYANVSFSIGDKGYIIGFSPRGMSAYDPATDTWVTKSIPDNTEFNSAFTIGSTAYITDDGRNLWKYDPNADTWTKLGKFPGLTYEENINFSLAGKGYILTGPRTNRNGFSINMKNLWMYDPLTNQWSEKAAIPGETRDQPISFTIDNEAYVLGGASDNAVYSYRADRLHTPTNLSLTLTDSHDPSLSWADHADSESSYIVERALFDATHFEKVAVLPENSVFYVDSSVVDTLSYTYRVVAISSNDNHSSYSNTDAVFGRPTNIYQHSYEDHIYIRWDNPHNASIAVLARSSKGVSSFAIIDTLDSYPGGNQYSDYDIEMDQLYTYQFSYIHQNKASIPGFATVSSQLHAPSDFTVQYTADSTVELTWQDHSSIETAYVIKRGTWYSEYNLHPIDTIPANATSYADTESLDSATYYYQISAINEYNRSAGVLDSIVAYIEPTTEKNPVTGLSTQENTENTLVYPNPGTGWFYVQNGNTALGDILIYDAWGHLQKTVSGKERVLDMRNLPNGIYLLRFKTNDGFVSKKIIKQ